LLIVDCCSSRWPLVATGVSGDSDARAAAALAFIAASRAASFAVCRPSIP
jgi:hypothetical protein